LKKNIFIIGGSGLIGLNLVNLLDNKINNIIVIDKINRFNENENIKFINLDITNIDIFKKKILKVFKKYKPNSMVNCSYPKTNDWSKNDYKRIKYKSYKKNICLHLDSYVWIAKFFLDEMTKDKTENRSIVLLSSIYGFLGQNSNLYKGQKIRENLTYSVIKGGIINVVRSLASYYGKYQIRINCVSPGGVLNKQDNKFIKKYSNLVPLKRMANSSEISEVINFLISEKSSYITGQNIIVDGGYSII
jgi:NAD(P)-dependent dehydrogenase (short-subunit alcohol dehydrogenase family)